MTKPVFVITLLTICLTAGGAWAEAVSLERSGPLVLDGRELPFSPVVRVGQTLYLSGQIGNLPGGMVLATGGIKAETGQVIENVKNVLEQHGSDLAHVAKCTILLADMGEWGEMNGVYRQYFPVGYPARSAVGASGLAIGARVEIECIAVVKGGG